MRRSISIVAILGLFVSVGTLALVPAAFAKIVIGQGVAGVSIGQSPAQVEGVLGSPTFKQPPSQGLTAWDYHKSPLDLQVDFTGGSVIGMWTTAPQQRTSKGISIDSTPAEVRKAYPKTKCTPGAGPQPGPGEQSLACVVRSRYHGKIVKTYFEWRNDRKAMEEIDIYAG
jgi:hypothetical protein